MDERVPETLEFDGDMFIHRFKVLKKKNAAKKFRDVHGYTKADMYDFGLFFHYVVRLTLKGIVKKKFAVSSEATAVAEKLWKMYKQYKKLCNDIGIDLEVWFEGDKFKDQKDKEKYKKIKPSSELEKKIIRGFVWELLPLLPFNSELMKEDIRNSSKKPSWSFDLPKRSRKKIFVPEDSPYLGNVIVKITTSGLRYYLFHTSGFSWMPEDFFTYEPKSEQFNKTTSDIYEFRYYRFITTAAESFATLGKVFEFRGELTETQRIGVEAFINNLGALWD